MRLGTAGAYAPAAALLTHFTGVAMSPATLRRLTSAAGTTLREQELADSAAVWAAGATAATDADPTVPRQLSVDASMVALVDEGWRAGKLAAIGERTGGALTALT
ncbi:MAG: hypothetical protein ACRDJW_07455 [Thermomicrobiales bacterium]